MVFGTHRQPLVFGIQTRSPGHCPAQQNAIQLQPQIVMQARGIVFLYQIRVPLARCGSPRRRFRRFAEIAFAFVFLKRHTVFRVLRQPGLAPTSRARHSHVYMASQNRFQWNTVNSCACEHSRHRRQNAASRNYTFFSMDAMRWRG